MDMALDETQQMLKNSAREFLSQECQPTLVRAMEEDERGYPVELWQQIVALGWTGLPFPEENGGTGGSFLDLGVLLEEMGRALVPIPFFSTVVLGGLTVLDGGNEEQRREVLSSICQGQTIMALALLERSATYAPSGIELEALPSNGGYLLNGTKLFVSDAGVADLMIVAARTSRHSDPRHGITLFLMPTSSQGVQITPHVTIALDKQAEVTLAEVAVPSSSVLGQVDEGWPLLERTLQRATAAKSLEMLGGADAVLEMTVEYVKQRVQFGRPVGSFQAVQHHCANMATDVEGSRNVAYHAAWRLSEGLPAAREVSLAKAWVSQACQRVAVLAHQCHGAIGFTKEHDLQLYTRRAKAQEMAYGDATFHRELLAQALEI